MPRYADMIATMPTDELRKQIESMKQERNKSLEEIDRIFQNAINRENGDYEIISGLLGSKIKQLNRKIHKAVVERGMRDIRETRG